MNRNTFVFQFPKSWELALQVIIDTFQKKEIKIIQSFALNLADLDSEDFCSHHTDGKCACKIVVLIIYGYSISPIILNGNSRNGFMEFEIVEPKNQLVPTDIRENIINIFSQINISMKPKISKGEIPWNLML